MKKKVKKVAKKDRMNKVVYWVPRILAILFIAFISLFALDVFNEYSGWTIALALLIHLIPSIILIIFLVVAWNWEKIGGVIFIALGIIFGFAFDAFEYWLGFLLLVLPQFIIGVLFLISHRLNK